MRNVPHKAFACIGFLPEESKCDVLVQHRDRVVHVLGEQELDCSWHDLLPGMCFARQSVFLHLYLPEFLHFSSPLFYHPKLIIKMKLL